MFLIGFGGRPIPPASLWLSIERKEQVVFVCKFSQGTKPAWEPFFFSYPVTESACPGRAINDEQFGTNCGRNSHGLIYILLVIRFAAINGLPIFRH